MRQFIIISFVVMVLSCIFNSVGIWMGLLSNLPPYPYGTEISEVKGSAPNFGTKREDFCYPEINFTTAKRPTMFITDITDKGDRSNAEFPLGANN